MRVLLNRLFNVLRIPKVSNRPSDQELKPVNLERENGKQQEFNFEPDFKSLKSACRLDIFKNGTTFTFPEFLNLISPAGQKSIKLEAGQENALFSFLNKKASSDLGLAFSYKPGTERIRVYLGIHAQLE